MKSFLAVLQFLASSVVLCGVLTGCSGSTAFPNVETSATETGSGAVAQVLKGGIHGGQQPIVGARIYLLAAGTTGYGSASTSLLTTVANPGFPTYQDSNGMYYVLTDARGQFQIADSCTAGTQVYVASVGGNPGGGSNTAATEIALLGQCPTVGNFDSALTNVFISEISTVAGAYATSAYAVDAFHIGAPSSTTLQKTGIANAFANAANLFDVQNINDLARSKTIAGNGTVPMAKVHTLANILAACVNSAGPSSPSCSTLFAHAKSAGSSGTAPLDITSAAINIAHNPWANVSTLFSLQATNAPFPSGLASAPNDFTLPVSYSSATLGSNPSLAVDAGGNVWAVVPGTTAVTKLSPLGALLSGSTGYAIGGGFTNARGLAFETNGSLFVLGKGMSGTTPYVMGAQMSSTGSYVGLYAEPTTGTTHPPTASSNLVVDASGNFYFAAVKTTSTGSSTVCCTMMANPVTSVLTELDSGNATPGTNNTAINSNAVWATGKTNAMSLYAGASKSVTGGGMSGAAAVALDNAGNAWIANAGNSSLSEFNSSGAAVTSAGYTGGGLSTPTAIAVDGLGAIWMTNSSGSYGLSQFSSAGTGVGSGYSSNGLTNAAALAIDPSGNIWVADSSSSTLLQYLGLAAPVVTPTATAVSNNALGARP